MNLARQKRDDLWELADGLGLEPDVKANKATLVDILRAHYKEAEAKAGADLPPGGDEGLPPTEPSDPPPTKDELPAQPTGPNQASRLTERIERTMLTNDRSGHRQRTDNLRKEIQDLRRPKMEGVDKS